MATATESDARARIAAFVPLVIAAVFAPLAWGSVTVGAERILLGLLALACLVGSRGYIAEGVGRVDLRRLPALLWGLAVMLVWVAWLNPRSVYDETVWEFTQLSSHRGFLPGTVDAAATLPVAMRTTVMAAAFFLLLWLMRDRRLRWKLLAAVALTGAVVAVAGLWLKASGSNRLLFAAKEYDSGWPFAVFRYHGHAGAFLNLSWPAALGLLLRSFLSRRHAGWRPLWIVSLVVILTAVFANSSKGGHAVAIAGLMLAVALSWQPMARELRGRSKAVLWGGGLGIVVLVGFAVVIGGGVAAQRWAALGGEQGAVSGRLEAYQYALRMVPDCGWFGFGPGTFALKFPAYTGGSLDRFWEHAHQDFLQTVIEWGWLGSALWFALFAGALWIGIRQIFLGGGRGSCLSSRVAFLAVIMICLHAAFDFPLQIPSLQLLACIWLACLWRGGDRRVSPGAKTPAGRTVN